MPEKASPIEILLVEDNPADSRLTQTILANDKICNHLSVVQDGASAIAFLRGQGEFAGAPRPDLILLDLNLPGKNGHEVLEELKADDDLQHIPVIILTGSIRDQDIIKSYDLQANCYIVKPINIDEFIRVAKSIKEFGLSIVRMPPSP